eukprot:gene32065-38777_t
MPRSSSRSSSRPAPAPARRAPAPAPAPAARAPPPPAAPAQHAPPSSMMSPAPQGGGMLAGLGATMAQGFAFGTGSAVARNVVNSVMGGGSSSSQPAPAVAPPAAVPETNYSGPCGMDQKAFMECLQQNQNNASSCDFYFNALQACQSRGF